VTTPAVAQPSDNFIDLPASKVISQTIDVLVGQTIRTTWVMMDPELAQFMLSFNKDNRPIDEARVLLLSRIQEAGDWDLNGATIVFSDEGVMLDAQHRLLSIVKSGISFPMLIVEGVPPSAGDSIDQSKQRSVGDILVRRGFQFVNRGIVVGIAKILMQSEYGVNHTKEFTADYVQTYAEELQPVANWAKTLSGESPLILDRAKGKTRSLAPSPLGVLYIHMTRQGADPLRVEEFFTKIATGMTSNETEMITFNAIRRRIMNDAPLNTGGGGHQYSRLMHDLAVFVQAYNRWISGETVQVVRNFKEKFSNLAELPKVVPAVQAKKGPTLSIAGSENAVQARPNPANMPRRRLV
jgi:hypothetical protein